MGQTQYMGILDMIPIEFNATDNSVLSYYTLDHVVGKNTDKYKQLDGYNCGIFIIVTMIMPCHAKQGFLQEK